MTIRRYMVFALLCAGTILSCLATVLAHEGKDYHAHVPGPWKVEGTTFAISGETKITPVVNKADSNRPRFVVCLGHRVYFDAINTDYDVHTGTGSCDEHNRNENGRGHMHLRVDKDDLEMWDAVKLGAAREGPMTFQVDGGSDGSGAEDHCLVTRVVVRP